MSGRLSTVGDDHSPDVTVANTERSHKDADSLTHSNPQIQRPASSGVVLWHGTVQGRDTISGNRGQGVQGGRTRAQVLVGRLQR